MKTIDVFRSTPPEFSRCRAASCNALIEWVRVVNTGRRMPINAPIDVLGIKRDDGNVITVIDGGSSHFATCPAAAEFRTHTRQRKGTRK